MKKINILLFLFFLLSCTSAQNVFVNTRGCFLLYNLKTKTFEKQIGEACRDRFPACSTFKVPLAVMSFDAKILKDENQILKWDGVKRMLDAWNQDHSAKSWMKESVVWFSQRLTPKLGERNFKSYLKKFNYGNQDISTGITTAWLNSPSSPNGFLGVSAYEQVEFMEKLWTNTLPVSKDSMELTQKIMYLETSPQGFKLSGKTGSNFYDKERKIQFGWFISHIKKDDKEYIAVTNLSDIAPVDLKTFGGMRAKDLTKAMLSKAGLW